MERLLLKILKKIGEGDNVTTKKKFGQHINTLIKVIQFYYLDQILPY